ncbi:MAG: 3-hydroxyacyl-ACP dehydratase FabZ family protein [Planctomycetia bacterium]|nr:3-hydroxyacyl-ACP dehydratase FabZ family protein [Planctomycetia bacterium]
MKEESFFDSRAAILAAIPHREPFLFIDEITELEDDHIVCHYRFKENEFFFKGHYPNSPIVPGVILCEAAMQAGAILVSRILPQEDQTIDKIPVVGRMNDIKFRQIAKPGDRVELRACIKEKIAGAYFLSAKVLNNGKTSVSFDYAVTLIDR